MVLNKLHNFVSFSVKGNQIGTTETIERLSAFFDDIFKVENILPNPFSSSDELFSEHLLLRFPLKILSPYDVDFFDPHQTDQVNEYINRFFTERHTGIKNQFSSQYKSFAKNARNFRKNIIDDFPELIKKVVWQNISYWCLINGRMPILANINNRQKNHAFQEIWDVYIANTTWLKKQRQRYNTLNEFICTEAENKVTIHIEFVKEHFGAIRHDFRKGIFKISYDEEEQKKILGEDLKINPDEYFKIIEKSMKDRNVQSYYHKSWEFLSQYFRLSKKNDQGLYKAAVIIQNISLWTKYYGISNGQPLIKNIYMFPVNIEKFIYGNLNEYIDITRKKPVSILAMATNKKLDIEEKSFIQILTNSMLSQALMLNLSKLISVQNSKRKESLIKNGIAAIMSRNGSHNIGSHVIAAVASKFHENSDNQILMRYIQQRMDFIAQITTNWPNWTYSAWLVRDVIRRFYLQKNLLDHIAESEGLSAYKFQEEIISQQKSKLIIRIVNKEFKDIIAISNNSELNKIEEDFQVAIPGGVVGLHAIYTIIENFIRNSAKHGWSASQSRGIDNLEITIRINYDEDDLNDQAKDYILFQIYDNCSFQQNRNLHNEINLRIKKSFVDNSGILLQENWGIAEMKIAAGYLNQKSTGFIGKNGRDVLFNNASGNGLIRALAIEDRKKKKYFGYEFPLKKPREINYITDKNIEKNTKKLAKKMSIFFDEKLTKNTDYELIVLEGESINQLLNKNTDISIEHLPYRIIFISEEEKEKLFSGSKKDFFSNRISVIKKKEIFENKSIDMFDENDWAEFKLKLYNTWVEHLMEINSGFEYYSISNEVVENLIYQDQNKYEFFNEIIGLFDWAQLNSEFKKLGQDINEYEEILQNAVEEYKRAGKNFTFFLRTKADESKSENLDMSINYFIISKYADLLYNSLNSKTVTKSQFDKWRVKVLETREQSDISFDKLIEESEFDDESKQILKKKIEDIYRIIKRIEHKYEEDIETLPKIYKVGLDQNKDRDTLNDNFLTGLDFHSIIKPKNIEITSDFLKTFDFNAHPIILKRHCEIAPHWFYGEALSGAQYYFSLLDNELVDESNSWQSRYLANKIFLNLVENAFLKIALVDERAADFYYNLPDKLKKSFDKANIFISGKVIYESNNSDKRNEEILIKSDKVLLKAIDFSAQGLDDKRAFPFHLLIIHQGILDKIFKDKTTIQKFLTRIKNIIPFVVVTSGRGTPSELPDDEKFIPFSDIKDYLLKEYHEKFILTGILMKIRARGNENE